MAERESRQGASQEKQKAINLAARQSAGRSYNRLQRLVHQSDAEISAFRFQLSNVWHVAAVGPSQPSAP